MAKPALEPKVARRQRVVDIDESIWRAVKIAAATKDITMIDAIEEALNEWLAE